jgi:hypothetical protein
MADAQAIVALFLIMGGGVSRRGDATNELSSR